MNRTFRLVILGISLSLLSACIPLPHTLQDLPAVHGVVTAPGGPLSGVRLHVSDVTRTNPCEKGEQWAETDAAGAFATSGRRRVALFAPVLPFHSMDTWAVAVIVEGKPLGYIRPWNYRAGPRHSPGNVELECDLQERTCVVTDHAWRDTRKVQLLPCDGFSRNTYQ